MRIKEQLRSSEIFVSLQAHSGETLNFVYPFNVEKVVNDKLNPIS